MSKIKLIITAEIRDIKVSKDGSYSFDYSVWIYGKKEISGSCDGSYSNQSAEAFRKVLKRGWALSLVMQQIF